MKLVTLESVFEIFYGHKLNFNAMKVAENGVNFVTRARRNMGVIGRVERLQTVTPFDAGLISVTLGGFYVLSCFVQPMKFYTAQNVKVLKARTDLSFEQKVAYCLFIGRNRFRYSSHGREANRSVDHILVPSPDSLPKWRSASEIAIHSASRHDLTHPPYSDYELHNVPLENLFSVTNGLTSTTLKRHKVKDKAFSLPMIRPSKTQVSSSVEFVDRAHVNSRHIYPADTLYVSTNGQGSHTYAYVSAQEFVPNSDVSVLLTGR